MTTLAFKKYFAIIIFLELFMTGSASAYIDPATGSMVLQMIIGGIAGAFVTVKLYWIQIKAFFTNKKSRQIKSGAASEDDIK